jgi:hypothetical protein
MVTVISGANRDEYPFEGQTVAQVRAALVELDRIESDAVATLNGARAGEDTYLNAGEELTFIPTLAQKG